METIRKIFGFALAIPLGLLCIAASVALFAAGALVIGLAVLTVFAIEFAGVIEKPLIDKDFC